jgi:arylsulfatase A-like enzyme
MLTSNSRFRLVANAGRSHWLLAYCLLCALAVASCGQNADDKGDLQNGAGKSGSGERYNVVLISLDSVRQDRLGAYGHVPQYAPSVEVTPNMDQLAGEGVVFDQAWSTSSWTLPSHMSAMTGLTDGAHGVVHDYIKVDPKRTTLAEQFKANGYQTAGFYSGPYLDPKYGFGKGFDFYASGMMSESDVAREMQKFSEAKAARGEDPVISEMERMSIRDQLSHEDITSPRINEHGLDFLDMASEEPFFLFLHYFDAHYDHNPEKMEAGLGKKFDPSYSGNFSPDRWYFNPAVRVLNPQTRQYDRVINERDLGHIMAWYDAEIHWVDRHIGQVVKRLKDLGIYENTIIAIMADHGDEFFEHNNIGHRTTLWTEVCKVPMILRVPGNAAPGKRVKNVMRLYDLAPSLVDLAGLPAMPDVQGQSVRELMERDNAAPRGMVSNLSQIGQAGPGRWRAQATETWRDQRFTIQRRLAAQPFADGSTQLPGFRQGAAFPKHGGGQTHYMFFDRQTDPMERKALPLTHPEFAGALDRYVVEYRRLQQIQNALMQSHPSERWPPAMSAAEIQTLNALGYTEAADMGSAVSFRLPAFGTFPAPLKSGY